MNSGLCKIERALISVSDKTGVVELARALGARGVEILSTGGTARLLKENGIAVVEVSDYTGFPEMMGGRVKTLHPRVHGGILGRRGIDEGEMQANRIAPIDLVAVNLYPFEATVEDSGASFEDAIENIDIGGPTLLRAAAKNHASVTVLVDGGDYPAVIDELAEHGGVRAATRRRLAFKAFERTARYDDAVSGYLGERLDEHGARDAFPAVLRLGFRRIETMRYGENPHQEAAFYRDDRPPPGSLAAATRVQGKAMSYNNVADADAALECVMSFDEPACVIVKHANPCGVAVAADLGGAYDLAFATDPTSAFGGIIAFNRALDGATARAVVERQFVEVIVAPGLDESARGALAAKPNVRVLVVGEGAAYDAGCLVLKRVSGGLLAQGADVGRVAAADLKIVTRAKPDRGMLADLLFAWRVVKFVKSNAIVYARDGRTIGVGAGQMNRVQSARIAAAKAADEGLEVRGSVMASDAFFPFRDGIDAAAEVGIRAVIQPGGSLRDEEVIAAADEHGMAMAFTGMRHFRH